LVVLYHIDVINDYDACCNAPCSGYQAPRYVSMQNTPNTLNYPSFVPV
jgi:hypothetical protein